MKKSQYIKFSGITMISIYPCNSYLQLSSLSSLVYMRTATLVTAITRQSQASRDVQTHETCSKGLIPNSAKSSRFLCSISVSDSSFSSLYVLTLSSSVSFIWREMLKSLDIETLCLVISQEDSNLFFL